MNIQEVRQMLLGCPTANVKLFNKYELDYGDVSNRLFYDPATGDFTWLTGTRAGMRAGCRDSGGYWIITLDGKRWGAHRLAYLLMTGRMPILPIDHENGTRGDNRWDNLRLASPRQNSRNRRVSHNKRSGLPRGVYARQSGRFQTMLGLAEGNVTIGTFDTVEEASAAYSEACRKHFGQFAN